MPQLRLQIEPIPASSRLASLANLLPPAQWDQLRRAVYRRANYRCQICGAEGRLHCHEVWQYRDSTGRQWLAGLQALCEPCHGVKHLHFTRDPGLRAALLAHFATVNHISLAGAESHVRAASDRQRWLDQRRWTMDYGPYNTQMPCLADLEHRRDFLRSSARHPAARPPRSLLAPEPGRSWEADEDY